jgi:uncharacterized protein
MPVFVSAGLDGPNGLDIRKATRPAHLDWIKALGVRVKLGGPIFGDDGTTPMGSIIFLEAASLEDAKMTFAQDPYRKAGLWTRVDIRPFSVVAGGFGG